MRTNNCQLLPFFALTFIVWADLAHAQEAAPDKWEKELAAMEARDAKEMAPKGGIIFLGSSSIRLWDLKKSFPELQAINHGFGGSQIADSVKHYRRLVSPLAPKTIVFYAGDNDIAANKSPEQVAQDFAAFHTLLRKELPDTKLIYLPIKPSPSRWKLIDKQRDANKRIRELLSQDSKSQYVELEKPMLGEDGQPRPELYRDDKLHLTEKGYELWTALLTPFLK